MSSEARQHLRPVPSWNPRSLEMDHLPSRDRQEIPLPQQLLGLLTLALRRRHGRGHIVHVADQPNRKVGAKTFQNRRWRSCSSDKV